MAEKNYGLGSSDDASRGLKLDGTRQSSTVMISTPEPGFAEEHSALLDSRFQFYLQQITTEGECFFTRNLRLLSEYRKSGLRSEELDLIPEYRDALYPLNVMVGRFNVPKLIAIQEQRDTPPESQQ